jgi:hypothetical protein
MRAASSLVLGLLLGGCGAATEPGAKALHGSFGTPIQDRTGYLAFSLRGSGEALTGRAWSSYSTSLLGGATLTGSYDPPEVHLIIRPLLNPTTWRFDGTLEGDTLKGRFGFFGQTIEAVELPRVDTIPLGEFSMHVTGALQDDGVGSAWFTYSVGVFQLVQSFQIESAATVVLQVFWRRRDLPPRGTYQLSEEGGTAPTVVFLYAPPLGEIERYSVQGGSLTLGLSTRYALAGSYVLSATSPAGAAITVSGKFSAGCTGSSC